MQHTQNNQNNRAFIPVVPPNPPYVFACLQRASAAAPAAAAAASAGSAALAQPPAATSAHRLARCAAIAAAAAAAIAAAIAAAALVPKGSVDVDGYKASCKLAVPCQRPVDGHVLVRIIRAEARRGAPHVPQAMACHAGAQMPPPAICWRTSPSCAVANGAARLIHMQHRLAVFFFWVTQLLISRNSRAFRWQLLVRVEQR